SGRRARVARRRAEDADGAHHHRDRPDEGVLQGRGLSPAVRRAHRPPRLPGPRAARHALSGASYFATWEMPPAESAKKRSVASCARAFAPPTATLEATRAGPEPGQPEMGHE